MGKSSGGMGGTTLTRQTAADHRVELKLRFVSRDYTLPQLRKRLQDIEALLTLLLADRTALPRPSRGRVVGRATITGSYVRRRTAAEEELDALMKGVVVEKVSLSSPLEILIVITAAAPAVAGIIKLFPKVIAAKNDWNDSRVKRAESNLKIDRIELERKFVKVLSEEANRLTLADYEAAGTNSNTKQMVKAAARAISQLDEAETKD
ncbi:hypothetical protein [Arthrobacter burdickii]|uniref:Uncharacterized protein n=1 Tax=Arthrobacter burdickii TaxID=3035920 RepID=A0ABT8K208_9MICC|nr:hypothetical protein [Arthrobacter burdickii]MDN4611471.1 hypothetical protein [Arthrobacter burdickii]